jgi:hypothetical protein
MFRRISGHLGFSSNDSELTCGAAGFHPGYGQRAGLAGPKTNPEQFAVGLTNARSCPLGASNRPRASRFAADARPLPDKAAQPSANSTQPCVPNERSWHAAWQDARLSIRCFVPMRGLLPHALYRPPSIRVDASHPRQPTFYCSAWHLTIGDDLARNTLSEVKDVLALPFSLS